MRILVLNLCLSIVLASFAPPGWLGAIGSPATSDLFALQAVDASLPPSADAGRGEGWQQHWFSQLKTRGQLPCVIDLVAPTAILADVSSKPPCPAVPTLLAQHVRLQV